MVLGVKVRLKGTLPTCRLMMPSKGCLLRFAHPNGAVQASMQRRAPPRDITASVVLIVTGCLIAGLGDLTFDLKGCAWSLWPLAVGVGKQVMSCAEAACTTSLCTSSCQWSKCSSSMLSTFCQNTLCRYVCALLSCGLQTGYLLLVERSGAEKGVGTSELLFYNALLSLPFLLTVRSWKAVPLAVQQRKRYVGVRVPKEAHARKLC